MIPRFSQAALLLAFLFITTQGFGGDDYRNAIETGDRSRRHKQFDKALLEFQTAFDKATNDTERGISLGKRAEIYADDLVDYDSARKLAEQSLSLQHAQPTSRVTALKVLARCQMKADGDPNAAIETLNRAAELPGVAWAQPEILLMLGDCYRATGHYEDAVRTYQRVVRISNIRNSVAAIAYFNTGLVYRYDLQQPDRAMSFFGKATDLSPGLQDQVNDHADVRTTNAAKPLILAHYMPWYVAKPFADHWGWHWTMNHFDPEKTIDGKRFIASRFYPIIGPYDSGDPKILEYHLLLMKLAGIDGVIVDWYGLSDFRDYAILHRNTTRLLQQCERLKMKFVICYEDQTIAALTEGKRISVSDRVAHMVKEINWLGKDWFQSECYVKQDGKPVLLSFGHTGLTKKEWSQGLSQLASSVAYFSQDIRREGAIGGFGWPSPKAGMKQVDRFLELSKHWPQAIPAAFPRFDDVYQEAGVSEGYPRLPDQDGRTLQTTLEKAFTANARIIQIATWNDWGEGTQIEPSQEFQYRDLEMIQAILRQNLMTTFSEADLRLPHRLLKLRQTGQQNDLADRISESISSGRLDAAKNALLQPSERE